MWCKSDLAAPTSISAFTATIGHSLCRTAKQHRDPL